MKGKTFTPLTADSKLKKFQEFINMNWRGYGGLNPVVMLKLRETKRGVFGHVLLGKLDNEGIEAGLRGADESEKGAVELKLNKSGRTAKVLMSNLTAEYPSLRVPKGRLRQFPVEFDADAEPPHLVLKLKESELIPVPKKKKSGESDSEAKATEEKKSAATKEQETKAQEKPVAAAEAQPAEEKQAEQKQTGEN